MRKKSLHAFAVAVAIAAGSSEALAERDPAEGWLRANGVSHAEARLQSVTCEAVVKCVRKLSGRSRFEEADEFTARDHELRVERRERRLYAKRYAHVNLSRSLGETTLAEVIADLKRSERPVIVRRVLVA